MYLPQNWTIPVPILYILKYPLEGWHTHTRTISFVWLERTCRPLDPICDNVKQAGVKPIFVSWATLACVSLWRIRLGQVSQPGTPRADLIGGHARIALARPNVLEELVCNISTPIILLFVEQSFEPLLNKSVALWMCTNRGNIPLVRMRTRDEF